jgi:uncharacterized OB-fold protein
MRVSDQAQDYISAVSYLKIDPQGNHWLAGSRCSVCGTVITGERVACPACGRRDSLQAVRLGTEGRLHSYAIVHRSFPDVKTPFVDAIVDLEGGGSIKGTLLGVEPDPAKLPRDLQVRVVFRDSGQKSRDGRSFLCHSFLPVKGDPS